ncbi:MAG: AMP phosphorylase [Patescibacteria group bacterium]
MSFFLKAKKLDFKSGRAMTVMINEKDAAIFDLHAGDRVELNWQKKEAVVNIETTKTKIVPGYIGLFKETSQKTKIKNNEIVYLELFARPTSIKAIKKKLSGQSLSYHEMYTIIRDLLAGRISDCELAFFIASGFTNDFRDEELYFLTKAMVDTGETVDFGDKKIVDKHCVGGLAGNRTTMVVVPIIAAAGLFIPKTSSRAVTSPAGTADTMEVLAPVTFKLSEVVKLVKKNHGCLVWGGATNIAPADDMIIRLTKDISLEPLSKMIVSIMAKKEAMGIKYLLIDIPVGPSAKIQDLAMARQVAAKFQYLCDKFGIKLKVTILKAEEPIGNGIGPALEARDVLRVLQQKEKRPADLEKKSLYLAGQLFELCGKSRPGEGEALARQLLFTKKAWNKMNEMIISQGGRKNIDSESITLGAQKLRIYSRKEGQVTAIDNRAIDEVARSLGAPEDKLAGMRLHQKIGDRVEKGEKLITLFARSRERILLAKKALSRVIIYKIGQ